MIFKLHLQTEYLLKFDETLVACYIEVAFLTFIQRVLFFLSDGIVQ